MQIKFQNFYKTWRSNMTAGQRDCELPLVIENKSSVR